MFSGHCFHHSRDIPWLHLSNFTSPRAGASLTYLHRSPYSNNHGLFVSGGALPSTNERHSTAISLRNTNCTFDNSCQWTQPLLLPTAIENHCTVSFGDNQMMIIGGENNHEKATSKTFIYSNGTWTDGPSMQVPRRYHIPFN